MSRRDSVSAKLSALAANPYWREADAREVLDLWRSSGLSLSTFAVGHGLSRNRLTRWRRRLEEETVAPGFHRVRVVGSPAGVAMESAAGGIEVLLSGGRRVAVAPGFDAELLADVVRALEAMGC